MDRQGLRRTIEKYGNFLNVTQVAECFCVSRDTARNSILKNLEYIPNGKEKLYFKEDILNVVIGKKRCES